ncbi:hypothetical protein [Ktedonobacter racemifer]|uniref:Uncharacterized protein n=1 Tax=Ktedonobacter racemifer DSM 44963 TaxID=485913 RepID=D6U514_KTERA|nr:hypothetical protein [Ktedonobacter racemifer]EFH81594.1 hypothetical protein Krac_2327 [Ktedonobacter racemifer DSM 44963]
MTIDFAFVRPHMALTSLSDLGKEQAEPAPWPIPHLLPPGLTLLTGSAQR